MKRLIGTLVLGGAMLSAAPAAAQEIQIRGPLAGARSVSRLVRYREGRFVLTPTFGITLQDEFSREMLTGLRAEYHFTDWLGLGVWGAAAPVHVDTSLTDQVGERSPANTPNVPLRTNFARQIGRRNFLFDLHASFIPLRGKFALFQSLVADVDFYFVAGVAFVGVEEREDRSITNNTSVAMRNASQLARATRIAVAPTFGFGINFYFNRFVSLNFEYRAAPFAWNRAGTDGSSSASVCGRAGNEPCDGVSDFVATYFPGGRDPSTMRAVTSQTRIDSDDRTFSFNQMVNLGISFYLPTAPRIGP